MTALKQGLGLLGLLIAVFAMALRSDFLLWTAVALLAASIGVRIVERVRRDG